MPCSKCHLFNYLVDSGKKLRFWKVSRWFFPISRKQIAR
jgi:hypothetical protein